MSELTPAKRRGRVVSIAGNLIAFGIVVAYCTYSQCLNCFLFGRILGVSGTSFAPAYTPDKCNAKFTPKTTLKGQ